MLLSSKSFFFFLLWFILFVSYLKNIFLSQRCKEFLQYFFFQKFYSLCFTFSSMIHYESVFVYAWGMTQVPLFYFTFSRGYLVVQTPFVEKTFPSSWIILGLLSKINWLCMYESISGLPNLYYWSICLS